MSTAIHIENVAKLYRLGVIGTGTISHDLNRWWARVRGKDDPYAKVGQLNDRTQPSRSKTDNAASEFDTGDGSWRDLYSPGLSEFSHDDNLS